MARHDGLTGLANRSVLLEKMEEALARLRRHGSPFTVFMLDLDCSRPSTILSVIRSAMNC